jgi:hypothetical protein
MASELKTNLITPASSTTVTIGESGDTISLGSGATASGFGGGKVLQVLQTVLTGTVTTSSTSMVDLTGLTQAITPSATTSKILVSATFTLAGNSGAAGSVQFMRDSTAIGIGDAASSRTRSTYGSRSYTNDGGTQANVHIQYLDPNTPADTSTPITYKIQWRTRYAPMYTGRSYGDTDNSDYNRTISEITVMEIGA